MSNFELVSYRHPEDGNWARLAVVYRELGSKVILGNKSTFTAAGSFGITASGTNSLAVVSMSEGASYALGFGHVVDSRGKVARLPDEYITEETRGSLHESVILPEITIGQPWDLRGTRSAEAGDVAEVWVDARKFSSLPRDRANFTANVPPIGLYERILDAEMQKDW